MPVIDHAAAFDLAGPGAVSFAMDRDRLARVWACRASAVFVPQSFEASPKGDEASSLQIIRVKHPKVAWSMIAQRLHCPVGFAPDQPNIHPSAQFETGVSIAPGVIIGPGAKIGAGTRLGPGCVIGPGVSLGRNCDIGPGASLFCCLVGDRVHIYAGARIGEAGFGAVPYDGRMIDVPQLGRAILQDGVTIGANTCIDRGALGDTVVGEHTKIDNLCQIAHNVVLGRNCVIAAHTGISGSVVVGDGVAFGGKAGLADHIEIGRGAQIAAGAGVTRSVPAGETWAGYPAKPIRQWLRETAVLARLARPDKPKG